MTQENLFCENCGDKITPEDQFCKSCGTPASNKGKFSGLQDFQTPVQPMGQPMVQQAPPEWEGGSLLSVTSDFMINPAGTAPSVLQAPNSPSTVIYVVITGLLAGFLGYLQQAKSNYVIGEGIDKAAGDALLASSVPNPVTIVVSSVVVVLIGWFIYSAILSLFVKGGFPLNHPLRYNSFSAMRKLNGYRYVPIILGTVIQIILLAMSPDQTIVYELQYFLGVEVPMAVAGGFGPMYDIGSVVITVIAGAYSLYLLYKAIIANQYSGVGLYVILLFTAYFGIVLPLQILF